ncbi:Gfo/Idh/MocA family protein [Alkaliphilus serpentinus]|uniref:Gfo/Idh/MocA family oxidoreductase n=1 Tax=Alkaliphilus serpentinus TaxID=1482731 RepID=A0A833HPQ3_9FIRM|nr:Gfo/Idh/MocA family oxidoreductase [Alkaliphilus serpentinus]KAB3531083.1 Gfo/Idh/MocA family oxidoreductase [Alkaliphilus serpentinus]
MNQRIKVGIIGVGIVGERFIKALQSHERAHILGIYDTNGERLSYISEKYQLNTVGDYKEILDDNEIDLIYLAVPPKYHHPIGMEIINAGKHFICEKPLANSVEEAEAMWQGAKGKGIVNAINFPTVYTSAFKKMKALLEEGYIGHLRRVELKGYFQQWPRFWQQTDWIATREQGGFVREVFTHYAQILQSLYGRMENIHSTIEYPKDPLKSEDGIVATASFKDGTRVLINGLSDIGMKDHLALTLYGSKGVISLENWRELWLSSNEGGPNRLDIEDNNHLVELIDEVFKAIDQKPSHVVSFEEGYHAQIVIEKLLGNY